MTGVLPETDLGALDGDPALFSGLAWAALQEDIASGDATTLATVPGELTGRAHLVARQAGVVSGVDAVQAVLDAGASYPVLGGRVELQDAVANGARVSPGTVIGVLAGPVVAILQLERSVLNVLSHASGVATHTAAWADAVAVARPGTVVRDSRKTLPGLRLLQKRAVVHGGGTPHRYNLSDQAMVKDNHVVAGGGVVAAYLAVRADNPALWCEVEVDDLDQLHVVLSVGEAPQQVLLDNFTVEETATAVRMRDEIAPGVLLESSGGLTLDVAGEYAAAGVDSLAVGALTHSVTALDIGLDL
ncbi:carboxylating nicotinate-nucleotide diphosphorylase [Corynebacterium sp.]|uniref:carboxylating nicotinate-nucleotide diphosphorylase n=1 Tax=Corynebacterium sp. TaxID=1720 RepID=UPI003B3A6A87